MLDKLVNFYWGRGLHLAVPMLSFYILVSLAPLILGMAAIAGIVFADLLTPTQIAETLSERFPEEIRDLIINLADSVRNQPRAVVLSILLMSWTFSSALMVIDHVMSPNPEKTIDMVKARIRLIFFGLLFASLLLISIAAGVVLAGISPIGGPLEASYGFLIIFIGCALIYKILPRKKPPIKKALAGAIPGSLALFFTPYFLTWYLSLGRISWGGLFAAVVVLLTSSYIMSFGLLLGAGIASKEEKVNEK